jgi:adenylate cyclase
MQEERVRRRLAAIMAVDVAGYGRLMEANEEATLLDLRQRRAEIADPAVARHDGRIFKSLSDGFLAEFRSAVEAASCAREIQQAMVAQNESLPQDRHITFRIGINLGDVLVTRDDVYGDDVNIASRMVALAPPGGIACSAGIRFQIGTRLAAAFTDLGLRRLRNIETPLHAFLLEAAASSPVVETGLVAPNRPALAVLPFLNMSGDPQQDYFPDGITEDLITDLSNVPELFVLSRNAVVRHKGRAADMEKTARDLGVRYILQGSVRQAGARLRITAQLTDGATGGLIWGERYDRALADIFALQDEITRAIVGQLKVKLLPAAHRPLSQASTVNVEAYTYVLRGREQFHRGGRRDYQMAQRLFAKAIAIDPDYARAHAGLADCGAFLFMDYSEDVALQVLEHSSRALALAPGLTEAHASRGLALSIVHRYAEAEAEFAEAMAQGADLFEVNYFYGRCCYAQGKLEETARRWERAAEVKPDDYQALILLNQVYVSLGQTGDAVRAARRGIARAERAFARGPENPRPAYFLATALAKLGEVARAEDWAKTALALAEDDALTLYNLACYHSISGHRAAAFDLLFRILPGCNDEMRAWILTDSDLAPLKEDERWQQVLRAAAGTALAVST